MGTLDRRESSLYSCLHRHSHAPLRVTPGPMLSRGQLSMSIPPARGVCRLCSDMGCVSRIQSSVAAFPPTVQGRVLGGQAPFRPPQGPTQCLGTTRASSLELVIPPETLVQSESARKTKSKTRPPQDRKRMSASTASSASDLTGTTWLRAKRLPSMALR